jgi:hypothetical protein
MIRGAVVNGVKQSSPSLSELALHEPGPGREAADKNSVGALRPVQQAFVGAGEALCVSQWECPAMHT